MFNQDMIRLGKKRSIIREIFAYSGRRKAEIGAENVFDFSLGNPSIPSPKIVTDTMKKLLDTKDPVALHGYTTAAGAESVRARLAENFQNRMGVRADASRMYMTCGAAASLTITLKAMVTPKEEVILLSPFFPEYRVFAANAGVGIKVVPCRDGDFQIDVPALEQAITAKTRAVIINSPNNPTGAVFTPETYTALAEMLTRKSAEYCAPIYILSDEPYRELVYGDVKPDTPARYYDNTVVCYSYSKSLSLPGERIGYILIPDAVTEADELFAAVNGAGRSLGFVCAPSLLQYTVAECDGTAPDLAAYDENRKLLYEGLTAIGYEVTKPDGAFYMFVKSPEPDAYAFAEAAKKYELLIVPGDDFGCPGYVRLAYCVTRDTIVRSLPAFVALYQEYKGE